MTAGTNELDVHITKLQPLNAVRSQKAGDYN